MESVMASTWLAEFPEQMTKKSAIAFLTSRRSSTAMSFAFFSSMPFTTSSDSWLEEIEEGIKSESKSNVVLKVLQYYRMNSNISTKGNYDFETRLHLPQCQSTNDVLLGLSKEKNGRIPEGFLVSTDFQEAGRGQKNNKWESEPGQNLMFSLFLKPEFLEAKLAFWLSASIAIGTAKALENYLPEVKVKWPNDLLVNGLKIGGILIENVVSGRNISESVVGIGLNINQIHLISTATSLARERHQDFDREEILQLIIQQILLVYQRLRIENWEKIRSSYYAKLYKMAIPHDYKLPDGQQFRGVLKGISEEGKLIVIAADGEKRFDFKEVGF